MSRNISKKGMASPSVIKNLNAEMVGGKSMEEINNKIDHDTKQGLADLVESTPDYIETLDSLKNRLKENPDEAVALTEEVSAAKKAVFIDLWNEACGNYGKYNSETGYFELNGITDIDYDEAIRIYNLFDYSSGVSKERCYCMLQSDLKVRTVMPIKCGCVLNIESICLLNSTLKAIRFVDTRPGYFVIATSPNYAFYYCSNLEHIYGDLNVSKCPIDSRFFFKGVTKLKSLSLKGLNQSIGLEGLPNLLFESWKFMVMNASNTNSITITLPSGIYAALQGEAEEYPFNGGTQEEWEQLLQDAAAKNIQFATA